MWFNRKEQRAKNITIGKLPRVTDEVANEAEKNLGGKKNAMKMVLLKETRIVLLMKLKKKKNLKIRFLKRLLEGTELEFCKWEGDVQEMLKDVPKKLNVLVEHWSRDEKNKSLRETKKSFQFIGHIVRFIIL
ncbi:unnamed protein product [Vicia faba]|uniref:Uncharacterized protein n=1 Tax=Vicia faba TaxID=3906 RepID=A0AAV1AL46_VICFA|nr:unnamed protein product [Vicia faba]